MSEVERKDVEEAYRVLLGRNPESDDVIEFHRASAKNSLELVQNFARSSESLSRTGLSETRPSPFLHVNSMIDVAEYVRMNIDPTRSPRSGYYVNFLGVAVPVDVFDYLRDKDGLLDEVPLPANWHADMAEWAAALRSIALAHGAGESFTMIELGSGWGCWMANTGVAAKRRGMKIKVIGIEGDLKHIDMCVRTMAANGITKAEYEVVRGIAAASSGHALFPKRIGDEARWGQDPVFGVNEEEARKAVESGEYEQLEMKALADVIGTHSRIDLLHIDIQGGEGSLIRDAIKTLNEKVAYILIGTHSRMLEGAIMDILLGENWILEIERPAIFELPGGKPQITVDGVQAWRNPRFYPE